MAIGPSSKLTMGSILGKYYVVVSVALFDGFFGHHCEQERHNRVGVRHINKKTTDYTPVIRSVTGRYSNRIINVFSAGVYAEEKNGFMQLIYCRGAVILADVVEQITGSKNRQGH